MSIASAVLASLQTFFNFASQAEIDRVAGVKYKAIIRELEQILTGPGRQLPENPALLDEIRQRLDDLELEAPVVPESIYRRVRAHYDNVDFVKKVTELVSGANG